MRNSFVLAVAASLLMVAFVQAEKGVDLRQKQAKPGTLIVDEKFTESQLGKTWSTAKGDWSVSNGVLVGKEKESDKHAGVIALNHPNRNSKIQFSFKFDGAKNFHLSLNHAKGHLFRVTVTETSLVVNKDKDKKDESSKAISLAKVETKFEPGKWYTMLVAIEGDHVEVQTDNGVHVQGNNPGLDIDKTGYRFVVSGQSLSISDLKVWEL
ncbi:MAG: family 16 glycoside hydrolase [Pirellulaceae bacterium]|nr:family 16 glycoside hydrolase [Pirellulaceae bacterium]